MRKLTPSQIAARDERRAKFKLLWKRVKDMPELDRVSITRKYGIRTVDGHELSLCNQMLCIIQNPAVSFVGGFRQWKAQGRSVRKGEHGIMIWVPTMARGEASPANGPKLLTETAGELDGMRFIVGTLFDISQTDALPDELPQESSAAIEVECELCPAC